ncbi:MAG: ERCC4 domain-containing protein [Candidatus Thermoplasmatota archaeon]|nr:ERCC4 domain-containing protein [Candidatus Thermoplasmatota archaeon]
MDEKISILVDYRERCSGIAQLLAERGVNVTEEQLPVGDYILSDRMAVERKRALDFLDSLVKKRLFDQIKRLAEAYQKPILIIEGGGLFSRSINERAIYGALSSIIADYGFSVVTSRDMGETASILYGMASREQIKIKKEIALRGNKPSLSIKEKQRYVVEGLPFISSVSAKKLLDYFGSVRRIMNATVNELCEIEGIGKKKAEIIKEIIEMKWEDD